MKIAMVTPWDEPCGIADYTRELIDALQPWADIKIVPLPHGLRDPRHFQQVAQACQGADLAHIQHEYILFGGRDPWNARWQHLVRHLPVPYVITSHTWLKPFSGGPLWKRAGRAIRQAIYQYSGWAHQLETAPFLQARRVIVHSQAYRTALIRQGVPAETVHVLFQGVPLDWPRGSASAARSRWELSGQVVVLLGFINPSKGHLLAMQAWNPLRALGTLVIAGRPFSTLDNAYAREVASMAERHPDSIRLLGYLTEDEMADLLAVAEVVLLPYTGGTSSYSLSLALAQGKAVLASNLDAFQEIYHERPCLELFEAGNVQELRHKLARLLHDAQQRHQLEHEASAWSQDHSWAKAAEVTAGIYRQALAAASSK